MADETNGQELTERHQPESIRLRKISPVLTVGDIVKSLAWYRDIIGFHVHQIWEDDGQLAGAELIGGTQSLMLVQDDWAKGRDRRKGQGFRLVFGTSQEVDEIADTIKERGGRLHAEPADMPWGGRAFDVVDPDGFKITISSV